MAIVAILGLLAFFMSVILHELAHGYTALYFGDDTAKRAGRLTLDPFAHMDIFGSIVLPILCLMSGSPVFGWAKPVPVNHNALPGRSAEIWVSVAGIIANLLIAVLAAAGVRILVAMGMEKGWPVVHGLLMAVVYMNLLLAVFNSLPIPPLDGWHIWGTWLPHGIRMFFEQNAMLGMVLLFLMLPMLTKFLISPVILVIVNILL